ncbi:hypothetical protein Hanom_Chr16g01462711 [Helianthus anomalus]
MSHIHIMIDICNLQNMSLSYLHWTAILFSLVHHKFKQLLFFPSASPPPSLTSSFCLLPLWPFLTFQSSPQSLSPTQHIFLQQHQMQPSNLESFIDSTTPVLPSRSLPKVQQI